MNESLNMIDSFSIFSSEKVCQVLINDLEFKKRWIQAVEWLTEHLDVSDIQTSIVSD